VNRIKRFSRILYEHDRGIGGVVSMCNAERINFRRTIYHHICIEFIMLNTFESERISRNLEMVKVRSWLYLKIHVDYFY
jgi:hypothetical protein